MDREDALQLIKDQAIEAASNGANEDWMSLALRGVRVVSTRRQFFTSDDVWDWMRPFGISTPDNRAMGSVMRMSYRDRIIDPTKEWTASGRSVCHGRPVRVWKSLRYEE
jgi:hypothetical protein